MRILRAFIAVIITIAVIYLLNNPIGILPALGKFLDPVNGCWTSAEPVNRNYTLGFKVKGLKEPVTVWYDERFVPHVHAHNDHDLYLVQGYIHAYFRLWQMDLQTRAAAGRISEVLGAKALQYDRTQRRKGMVYAAENSLQAMEQEPRTKLMIDAYTEGVNSYISSLSYHDYSVEYKLMGFAPEDWTNIKTALLLKYMADDLTGKTDDIGLSILKGLLSQTELDKLFPDRIPGTDPVIPAGTTYEPASLKIPVVPASVDSLFPRITGNLAINYHERNEEIGIGSNNWALSGVRTKQGAPILCNDPHLGLNLPALWFEMQLQAPGINVYGVSLPGAPGIIIGFNDSISWGLTNNYRDVKDYYLLKADGDKTYLFDGAQVPFKTRIERIAVKNADTFSETVNYTIHGPVMYDSRFPEPQGIKGQLAMCWMAHRGTNELLCIYLLNRAKTYIEFTDAIQHFECPAQNMIYADKAGNIALWGQGQFINKWKDQGKYVMDGTTSKTLWGQNIPMQENPHVINPPNAYLASANQLVTDTSYPYWYNGNFVQLRSWRINQVLEEKHAATIQDMFHLQNDVYSILAAHTLPFMLKHLPANLNEKEKGCVEVLQKWDYKLTAESKAAAYYQVWWYYFFERLCKSECRGIIEPLQERTMQLLVEDSAIANRGALVAAQSFKDCMDSIGRLKNGEEWYQVKNTTAKHLSKLLPFSYPQLKIGGWGNVVNAASIDHGPSWRMVVQMGNEIEAYGVYPGGQSGNPGSKYYATFLNDWVEGKYYRLQFLPNMDKQNNTQIKYTWNIQP